MPTNGLRCAAAALVLVLGAALSACEEAPLPGRRTGRRVLVIGLDGADWDRIAPMVEQGRLPHMGALMARGTTAQVAQERPPLSPLLWTTLATSRWPDAPPLA